VTHSTWAATQSRLDVAVCCSVLQSVAMGCGVLQRTSSHSTWAATQSRLMSPWSLSHVTLAHVVILLVWRLDLHFIEVF